MDEQGLTIVLSPVQLAAVLSGTPISDGEMLSNRLWGGVKVLGGSFEMVGAAALMLAPEPTMATKVGGAALGIHGSDTISAGVRQVWTGRDARTLTDQGSSAIAKRLGASQQTADTIGATVDVVVPLAVSIGAAAARVAAIRATQRISLVEHEAVTGTTIGGHTIAKHIGKTEAELRARLLAEPHVPIASTFKTLDVAERLLYKAMQANRVAIEAWARTAAPNAKYVVNYVANEEVGMGVIRATGQLEKLKNLRIVFKLQLYQGKPYYILTSFPTT